MSTFKQEVITEATKTRWSYNSKMIDKRHIESALHLKEERNITIRKADNAAVYVIINTSEYLDKIDLILSDTTKFKRITKDPIELLKKKINILITSSSAKSNVKFDNLSGDYEMGYLYDNVKTHKPGNKMRLIISQIPTLTYTIAKKLCDILTLYTPNTYTLLSTTDLLDLLKTKNSSGNIASLDVESLFTNIPVDRTINYIINRVYQDDSTPTLDIPEEALRGLLECCTKEAPLLCPRGNRYQQIDGVAMESPLGVLFANFFMGCVEEETFKHVQKPDIYCRYIDDIFIKTEKEDAERLKLTLQETLGLTFTTEKSKNGTMPFLDVLIWHDGDKFNTDVYIKPSNSGNCLNCESECPQRYKDATIGAYIHRAITHCSTWQQVHQEIERSTKVLINNGFDEQGITRQTRNIIDDFHNKNNTDAGTETINLYYRAHFFTAYKEEERVIKQTVKRNVKTTNQNKAVTLTIEYKSKKTSHLLLRN